MMGWIGLGFIKALIIGSDRRPETKQGIEEKLIGSDREGLGLGLGIRLGLGITDRRSEPNTVLYTVKSCLTVTAGVIVQSSKHRTRKRLLPL